MALREGSSPTNSDIMYHQCTSHLQVASSTTKWHAKEKGREEEVPGDAAPGLQRRSEKEWEMGLRA